LISPDISSWFELLYQIQRWPDMSFFYFIFLAALLLVAFAGWGEGIESQLVTPDRGGGQLFQ